MKIFDCPFVVYDALFIVFVEFIRFAYARQRTAVRHGNVSIDLHLAVVDFVTHIPVRADKQACFSVYLLGRLLVQHHINRTVSARIIPRLRMLSRIRFAIVFRIISNIFGLVNSFFRQNFVQNPYDVSHIVVGFFYAELFDTFPYSIKELANSADMPLVNVAKVYLPFFVCSELRDKSLGNLAHRVFRIVCVALAGLCFFIRFNSVIIYLL